MSIWPATKGPRLEQQAFALVRARHAVDVDQPFGAGVTVDEVTPFSEPYLEPVEVAPKAGPVLVGGDSRALLQLGEEHPDELGPRTGRGLQSCRRAA